MTLQTVKSQGIERIDVYPPDILQKTIGEAVYPEWQDLDCLLVQFWTSHSVRLRVVCVAGKRGGDLRDRVPSSLPELTRRRFVDLVEKTYQSSSEISMTVSHICARSPVFATSVFRRLNGY